MAREIFLTVFLCENEQKIEYLIRKHLLKQTKLLLKEKLIGLYNTLGIIICFNLRILVIF